MDNVNKNTPAPMQRHSSTRSMCSSVLGLGGLGFIGGGFYLGAIALAQGGDSNWIIAKAALWTSSLVSAGGGLIMLAMGTYLKNDDAQASTPGENTSLV